MPCVADIACLFMHTCWCMQADSVLEGFAPVALEDTETVEAWLSLGAPQPIPSTTAVDPVTEQQSAACTVRAPGQQTARAHGCMFA